MYNEFAFKLFDFGFLDEKLAVFTVHCIPGQKCRWLIFSYKFFRDQFENITIEVFVSFIEVLKFKEVGFLNSKAVLAAPRFLHSIAVKQYEFCKCLPVAAFDDKELI